LRDPLENWAVAWAIGLGLLLGFDFLLKESGRTTLTDHARKHPYLAGAGISTLIIHIFRGSPL
jgi:hypothetical protein